MGEVTIPSTTSLKDSLKNLSVEKGSYQEKMKLLNQRIQESYIKTKESPNIKTKKFSKTNWFNSEADFAEKISQKNYFCRRILHFQH